MTKMLFDSPQEPVTITSLPDGKWDVTVLDNEEQVTIDPTEEEEEPQEAYQYDGNIFRTVYEPPQEEEILADLPKWLDYTTEDEPTPEQLQHDNDLIDALTMELVEGGIL